MKAIGCTVSNEKDTFHSFQFELRELGSTDVLIDILFCGIDHTYLC